MILKDFSDKLIALYEDTEDTKETTTSEEGVENNTVTILAETDLNSAHALLTEANPDLAKKISYNKDRYRISFKDLEEVYSMLDETPGLLEF